MDGDFEGPVVHFQRTGCLGCNRAVVLGWDQPSPQNLETLHLATVMRFRLQDVDNFTPIPSGILSIPRLVVER